MRKHTKSVLSIVTALAVFFGSAFAPASEGLPGCVSTVFAEEAVSAEEAEIPAETEEAALSDDDIHTISSGQVEDVSGNTISWTISDNNVLTFTGEGAIPDYAYNDQKPWQREFIVGEKSYLPGQKVTQVVIAEGITRIGEHAFDTFRSVTEVELPESLTEIGNDAFNGCKALTAIDIPGNVTKIGEDAFSGCSSLSQIKLPEGLKYIGKLALWSTGLESVTLPSSLISMGTNVFDACAALKTVSFNENSKLDVLPDSTFTGCTSLSSVELPKKLKTIGKYAFYKCGALKGIDLPDTLEEIGVNAFSEAGLVSIEIPSNVQKLGQCSFQDCTSLKRVSLGNNITERGTGVFSGCSADEKYMLYSGTNEEFEDKLNGLNVIPNSTDFTVIYNYKKGVVNASAESGTGKATIEWDKYYDIDPAKDADKYEIEMKNEEGEWEKVSGNRITNYESYSDIKELEPGKEYIFRVLAYYNEKGSLKQTAESEELSVIPSNVIKSGTIGENNNITWEISPDEEQGKFILTISGEGDMPDFSDNSGQPWKQRWSYGGNEYGYNNISRIIIKDGITGTGDSTFLSLKEVTEVTLPKSLKTIGSNAFKSCKELSSLTLPESLKTIGSHAFDSCEKLSSLTLNEGLESIEEFAFSETALTNVNIPESVKTIGRYAFAFNEVLETVSLNEGLETIATAAFQQCPIKDITIPASVKEMGTAEGSPFCMCTELDSIRVAEGNNYFKVVDGVLFSKDGKRLIHYPAGKEGSTYTVPSGTEKIEPYAFTGCSNLQKILIPEGAKSIGDCAFAGNKMESVNIPDSVTELGLFLFCQGSAGKVILPKNLDKDHLMPFLFMAAEVKDVYFPGSKEEWQALEDSFRDISDERKLEIMKTMFPIMGEEWKDPETEEARQYLIGMYNNQFGSLTLLDYKMDEEKEKMLSANLICDYREDLSDKGYEIADIPEQTWTGNPVEPEITVSNADGILYPGCYSVEYKNNTGAGTGSVTVKGRGRYIVSLSKSFVIKGSGGGSEPAKQDDEGPEFIKEEKKDASGNEVTIISVSGTQVEEVVKDPESGKETIKSVVWIDGLEKAYTYTGAAIRPSFHVYDGSRRLAERTDYTVSYKDNKDVGKAEITIKFKGSYKSEKPETAGFEIKPAVFGKDIIAHELGAVAGKKAQKPVPVLTWALTGKTLNRKYYDVSYEPSEVKDAGVYKAFITPKRGNADFTGRAEALIMLTDKSRLLSNAKVNYDKKHYGYTGKAIVPEYTLTLDGKELKEGTDFERVGIYENTAPGTATVIFEAVSGNAKGIAGSKTSTFKISGKKELKEGAGFEFSYSESVLFAKGGARPAVSVYDRERGVRLKEGVDYTLSYSKNKSVTNGEKTAMVRVKGKGNYKGTVDLKFAVEKQSLAALVENIAVADQFVSRKNLKKPSVKVTDLDGKKLKSGTDFSVVKADDQAAGNTDERGEVFVTLKGRGNYKDEEVMVSFRYTGVVSENLAKAKTAGKIGDQIYTGKAIKLSNEDLAGVLRSGSTVLVPGKDFRVRSYSNNIKKGTAKVTLQGIGAYAGQKTVTFKIVVKPVDYKGSI